MGSTVLAAIIAGVCTIAAALIAALIAVWSARGRRGPQPPEEDALGGDNQRWRVLEGPIRAKHSGKVLDVRDISTADGAQIQQWDYWGADNQRWKPYA